MQVFLKFVFLRFSCIFDAKNLSKALPKRGPNPSKIHAKNESFFNIDFLGFRPRFRSLLGLQLGAKLVKNRKKSGLGMVWVWSSKPSLNRCLKKWRLGGLQTRFWRLQASILEAPASILKALGLDFEGSRLQFSSLQANMLRSDSFSARFLP